MRKRPLPRYVIPKRLAAGKVGFFFNVPSSIGSSAVPFEMNRWEATIRRWNVAQKP